MVKRPEMRGGSALAMQILDDTSSLKKFRNYLMASLTELMTTVVRASNFGEEITAFYEKESHDFLKRSRHFAGILTDENIITEFGQFSGRCLEVRKGVTHLIREKNIRWQHNRQSLKELILEINNLLDNLEKTLIDKDLLERQSRVLRNIILSHERISQWKEFVQEILTDFYHFFPFDMFFIAFAEEHGLSLNIYHMGKCNQGDRKELKKKLSSRMLEELNLPVDSLLETEEFEVLVDCRENLPENIELLSVPVPESLPGLEGVLGVGYAVHQTLTTREKEIIRSILSVMVMVVGSSKALTKTIGELEYYSVHDPLTGLHNRRYFNEMLSYEIGRSERHSHNFSIIMIDLDNFKDINDSYGHPCGDVALTELSALLLKATRKGDVVTRLGGDEFAIILTETSRSGALVVAESVRKMIRQHSFINSASGEEYHLTISSGVISYPEDAKTIDELMSGVDIALYRSKQMGKDTVCIIDSAASDIRINRQVRQNVENLRVAVNQGKVKPYFHEIVRLSDGKIHAYEALARIEDEDGRVISASSFIETAEKYGLSWDLDREIIQKAVLAKKEANRKNPENRKVKLFINLSPQVIQGRGILNFAEKVCQKNRLSPDQIVFEILERDAIGDLSNMRKFLSGLREKGFAFALDDFGSGYNSFHYLRELRFEYVKIDGAFIQNMHKSRIDKILVKNLANLCQDLGIHAIAEFVESEAVLNEIRAMGIEFAQGFHLGVPRVTMSK